MEKNIDSIKYSSNYLSSVICRVDFAKPLSESVITQLAAGTEISTDFPIRGKDQVATAALINVSKSSPDAEPVVSEEKSQIVMKQFHDLTGKNKCVLSPQNLVFEYSSYDSFESLQVHFMRVVEKIIGSGENTIVSRFGLRYINTFNSDNVRIQKGFFSDFVSAFVNLRSTDDIPLSRAMGHMEYLQDDIRLTFNYGKFNRNYPGILQKNDFVLDYDAVIQGTYDIADLFPSKLVSAHKMIQTTFENCITDKLRATMNGEKNE